MNVLKFDLPSRTVGERGPDLKKRKQRVTKKQSEINTARQIAKEKGELHFSIASPCVNGHSVARWVSTGGCTACSAEKAKTQNSKDANKRYYQANKEQRIAHSKVWKKANPTAKLKSDLKIKYNMSVDAFYEMLAEQNNACAICVKPFENPKHRHVDHCHTTGRVRGILCNRCNLAVGFLGDSPELAIAAAEYLK